MVVMTPREKWNDERLDEAFARLDSDIRELRTEMNRRFDAQNESINARFDAQNRNMIAGIFMVIATVIGSSTF
jgi:hypothetical protein